LNDYFKFLMFELPSITEEFDTDSERVHEICVLLAVDGKDIPETFYRLYVTPIGVDQTLMNNAMSYFTGAGFLNIKCDCEIDSQNYCELALTDDNIFYDMGQQDRENMSENYVRIYKEIKTLHMELSECW